VRLVNRYTNMSWKVERTDSFKKWWKKEKVDDGNYKWHKQALEQFENILLPHGKQSRIFQNDSFECWVTRLPDKVRKQGKRGGFRVILVLDLEENILLLQGIFRRSNLSYKNSGQGKRDTAFENLIKAVAAEFIT